MVGVKKNWENRFCSSVQPARMRQSGEYFSIFYHIFYSSVFLVFFTYFKSVQTAWIVQERKIVIEVNWKQPSRQKHLNLQQIQKFISWCSSPLLPSKAGKVWRVQMDLLNSLLLWHSTPPTFIPFETWEVLQTKNTLNNRKLNRGLIKYFPNHGRT